MFVALTLPLAGVIATPARGTTDGVTAVSQIESTRAQALGGAATALGHDAALAWLNPASLAGIPGQSVTLGGQRGFYGELTGHALWSRPVSSITIAAGVIYDDAGSVSLFAPDGSLHTLALQQDFAGLAGIAGSISNVLVAGGSVKILSSRLVEAVTTSAVAVDFGVQASVSSRIKIGAAIRNAGSRLHYGEDPVSLPSTMHAGVATALPLGGPLTAIASGDLEYGAGSGVLDGHAGA